MYPCFVERDLPHPSTSKMQMPSCAATSVPLPSKAELAQFPVSVLSLQRNMAEAVQRTDQAWAISAALAKHPSADRSCAFASSRLARDNFATPQPPLSANPWL